MWAWFCNRWYGADGINPPLTRIEFDDGSCDFRAMGLHRPDAPPIVMAAGPGTIVNKNLRVAYSYYDSQDGRESLPSEWSTPIRADNHRVAVTGFLFPPPGADRLRIYANVEVSPLRGFFVTEVPFTMSLTLTWDDNTLGLEMPDSGGLPPLASIIKPIGNRLYMTGFDRRNPWGGWVQMWEGSNEFRIDMTPGSGDQIPGRYLIGERLIVQDSTTGDYFEDRNLYVTEWDELTYTGKLQNKWKYATSPYDYWFEGQGKLLYWSGTGDLGAPTPEAWNIDDHYLYVPCEDNDRVTGLTGWGTRGVQSVCAFTEKSLWMTTVRHEQLVKTEVETGTISPFTVHTGYNGYLYWVGSDGQIYAFNGQNTDRMSKGVQQLLSKEVDCARLEDAWAAYDPKTQRQWFWLPKRDVSDLFLLWWDHQAGQTFKADMTVDVVRELVQEEDTFILVKIVDDWFTLGYLTGDQLVGDTEWVSGHYERPQHGETVVGRVALTFEEATGEGMTITLIDEKGQVQETQDLVIDDPTVRAGFRSRMGAWKLKLESDGKLWVLRSIDIEDYPVRI